jgi:tetratricopeptide (TPR) repeat protein
MFSLRNPPVVSLFILLCSYAGVAQALKCGSEDYQCEIEAYTKEIKANPNDLHFYFDRGKAYEGLKSFDAAIADLSKYISDGSLNKHDLANAYAERAMCYRHLKKLDPALSDYSSAIQLEPDEVRFLLERGDTYSHKSKFSACDHRLYISHNAKAVKCGRVYFAGRCVCTG